MRSTAKKGLIVFNFFLLWGCFNIEYLAETKNKSIINIFCIENFKEEMLKANIIYEEKIANETCNCYLKEFINTNSHQKAINKCKLETKKKLNL
tara:strand:- start:135 stop:416 length:282 start_codon:yes stop_codon:yes gene_type:complete